MKKEVDFDKPPLSGERGSFNLALNYFISNASKAVNL